MMPGVTARLPEGDARPPVDGVIALIRAIERYKRESGRLVPTWSEILEVIQGLGGAEREARP